MCIVNPVKIPEESKKSGFGYKVFEERDGKLYSPITRTKMSRTKWNTAERPICIEEKDFGFHIFFTNMCAYIYKDLVDFLIMDGRKTLVKKVEYKKATVTGITTTVCGSLPTVVAKKMRICKEEEE